MPDLAPVMYLPHGGGPMPLLGDPSHGDLMDFLRHLPAQLNSPRAVLLVSAHWEAPAPAVCTDAAPALLFDYYGFPPETYEYRYPAPGDPMLARQVAERLRSAGISCTEVADRGFDHGMFVPMMLMYPQAEMPCVQLSLVKGLDAEQHLQLGEALAGLREQGVAIIGSGMSFHNLRAIGSGVHPQLRTASDEFHHWLTSSMQAGTGREQRRQRLAEWEQAPWARFAHPREEHLLPLHVCAGAAGYQDAELIYDSPLMGHRVAGFGWF
jgi:4,5-DOPA dioxygenase extradiol